MKSVGNAQEWASSGSTSTRVHAYVSSIAAKVSLSVRGGEERLGGTRGTVDRAVGVENVGVGGVIRDAYESSFSRRTTIDFEVGVLLTSAVESNGTSTFVSG